MTRRRYHKIRTYSLKKYQNPFFNKKRARIRRISWKVKILIFFVIIAVIFLGKVLFFNEYFEIQNVVVEGSEKIKDYKIYDIVGDQAQKSRLFFFNQSNIFAFSKRQAKKEILKSYFVDDLKINKDLPKTIKILFKEREPSAVWREGENYYYIDDEFNVLLQIDSLEVNTEDYIVLKNVLKDEGAQKEEVIKKIPIGEEYLKACLTLSAKVNSSGIETDKICEVNKREASVNLNIINNGPKIFFNIEEDLGAQFKKLQALLSSKLKGQKLERLKYIDLRFGEKVYYK